MAVKQPTDTGAARNPGAVMTVPTIDIAGWYNGGESGREAIARDVDLAARTVGFMQIVGHGIPKGAASDLAAAMDGFFALPLAEKRSYRPSNPSINRGYSAPRSERLSHSLGVYSPDDLFEAFNVGSQLGDFPGLDLDPLSYSKNIWPADPAQFRDRVSTWFDCVQGLGATMTDVFALALGLPEGYFTNFTDHSVDMLRMNNYQVPEGDVRLEPGQLGMGPHTDFGIVTLLWADPLPGLQILDTSGAWHDVVPQPGALLVNLGDLLARWTNDRWRSTMHRVLAPIDAEGRPFRRRSAAFFLDGNADAVITTLPGCLHDGIDPYEPVTVAEHLRSKLAGSRGLELNANAAREASRLPTTA
jgi:isopenicillin N synthase-like dioxygenase